MPFQLREPEALSWGSVPRKQLRAYSKCPKRRTFKVQEKQRLLGRKGMWEGMEGVSSRSAELRLYRSPLAALGDELVGCWRL